ncbi:MAG: type II CRISPR RNA-guided endonuclease Cas9 [Calditrichaceae bacterium]
MANILGLDLGANSIGWALINDTDSRIIATGVRVFPEGVERSGNKSEESRNAKRRQARLIRRNLARKRSRRDFLIKKLKTYKMFPNDNSELEKFFKMDPYEIREKAIIQKISLLELGRALYHINLRRGFLSNRKMNNDENNKIYKGSEGKIGITETQRAIIDHNALTLGQYLAGLNPHEERRRNRYTLRDMYNNEFNQIWEKQTEFYNDFLTDEMKTVLENAIFFQRKMRSQKHLIGTCTFERSKKTTPKSSPFFQYFRILEQVNNLRLTVGNRFNEPLTEDERVKLITELKIKKEIKFTGKNKLATILDLPEDTIFNLTALGKLMGDTTSVAISKVFGQLEWEKKTDREKLEIWHVIHSANEDKWLEKYAKKKWNLDDDSIKKLLKVSLEKGYGRLSRKAIEKMIPFLEKGLTYDDAAKEAGYHHSKLMNPDSHKEQLPEPENLRNPIVQQALYQVRNVINAIIVKYGKPDIVRVELARELKLPKKRREEIHKENAQRENKASEIRKILQNDIGIKYPSRDDIQKYLLWEECDKTCPYTAKKISLAALFNGDFEIEHIIPYSRSLDDSLANKTLCFKSENLIKSNKTPYEAYGHDQARYQEIVDRVKKFNHRGKLKKFLLRDTEKVLKDEFLNRHLNDTAYISRSVHNYLKKVFLKVQVAKGGSTAILRKLWGLNSILSQDADVKNRFDHRHHSVDALVVACTNIRVLQILSTHHASHRRFNREVFPAPWKDFRRQAGAALNAILVSHKFRNRVRGSLHNETYYGRIKDNDGNYVFVVRKKLEQLTSKMLQDIVDERSKEAIHSRITDFGFDPATVKSFPKEALKTPILHPVTGLPIKKVRVKIPSCTMRQLYKDRNVYVEPGGNHHIEIFENPETGVRIGKVVTLFDAVQRKKQGLPIINKENVDGFYFKLDLAINEMILLNEEDNGDGNSKVISDRLYRVQKISQGGPKITFRKHNLSYSGDGDPGVLRRTPSTLMASKVRIDILGELVQEND